MPSGRPEIGGSLMCFDFKDGREPDCFLIRVTGSAVEYFDPGTGVFRGVAALRPGNPDG